MGAFCGEAVGRFGDSVGDVDGSSGGPIDVAMNSTAVDRVPVVGPFLVDPLQVRQAWAIDEVVEDPCGEQLRRRHRPNCRGTNCQVGSLVLCESCFVLCSDERDELVDLYANDASENQRDLFRASLHAAFTPEELRTIADEAGLEDAVVVIDSDRHMSLQVAAK